jgi:hypothetical protein
MYKISVLFAATVLMSYSPASAGDWDDICAPYLQRIDKGTSSSGNAKAVNSAIQIINPWPRNVRNRNIPANGARMVGAIKRYESPSAGDSGGDSMDAASSGGASTSGGSSSSSQSSGTGK